MMYNTTRDKLRRMEEQHQLEVQERQKVELTLRNMELEMGALLNNMKQVQLLELKLSVIKTLHLYYIEAVFIVAVFLCDDFGFDLWMCCLCPAGTGPR